MDNTSKGPIRLYHGMFLSTLFVSVKANERYHYNIPKFHSVASASNKTILYNFTCTMFNQPDGGILQFHVNQRSIDTMRLYNNTCYSSFSKCAADTCSSSYNNCTFIWSYSAIETDSLKRFEIEMIFINAQLGKIHISLSRTYNKTAIIDIGYNWKLYSSVGETRTEMPTNGNDSSDLTFNICLIAIGLIVGMLIPISIMRIKRSGCFQRFQYQSTQNNENEVTTCIEYTERPERMENEVVLRVV